MPAFATIKLLEGDRDADIAAMYDLMANYWPNEDPDRRLERATAEIDEAYALVNEAPTVHEARAAEFGLQAMWERTLSPHVRTLLDGARRTVLAAYAKERLSK